MLLRACSRAGVEAACLPWDDPEVDWAKWDLVVPRSTWNYFLHEVAFREWIGAVNKATKLLNSADLMLANIHKGDLQRLAAQGIRTVPTVIVQDPIDLEALGWRELVIKPAVSAASYLTRGFCISEIAQAQAFLKLVLEVGDAMVQPYLRRAADGGEVALVHINGQLTHGVVKFARFAEDEESVAQHSFTPSEEQLRLAESVMATVRGSWLYARVDLMQSDGGEWLLSELELIEPSLFFLQHRPALDRFVAAIASNLA